MWGQGCGVGFPSALETFGGFQEAGKVWVQVNRADSYRHLSRLIKFVCMNRLFPVYKVYVTCIYIYVE